MALYAVVFPLTLLSTSLALAMTAAACGARLATEHGARVMAETGKLPDADAFLASKSGDAWERVCVVSDWGSEFVGLCNPGVRVSIPPRRLRVTPRV